MRNASLFVTTIAIIFILSCGSKKLTFDNDCNLTALGQPIKIEYYKREMGQAPKLEFTLTEKIEITQAIDELKTANKPKPWKGAKWNNLILTYIDTIVALNTDGAKIGRSSSGLFYYLKKNNFINKQRK